MIYDLDTDLTSIFGSGSKGDSEIKQGFRYELKIDEIIWPRLSSYERPTKRARHSTSCSSGIILHNVSIDLDAKSIDSVEILESGKCKSEIRQGFACEEDNKLETETWTLQKSSNLCSPFVPVDRGCEVWRDFL
jgi:hypothetical protein